MLFVPNIHVHYNYTWRIKVQVVWRPYVENLRTFDKFDKLLFKLKFQPCTFTLYVNIRLVSGLIRRNVKFVGV